MAERREIARTCIICARSFAAVVHGGRTPGSVCSEQELRGAE
ncbi:hypothetical protein [Mesorhizobium sp. ZC-5]|nr:hypothetical protein [Mesorhizobium sp. ZC-5]MCV3240371.1 hypothetical protein [Mesorhizobium sp. ZC-5]